MNEQMERLCNLCGVEFSDLMNKVRDGLNGVSISHFTDAELKVIHDSLLIAGE